MADSAIRTLRGAGGPRSLRHCHFAVTTQPDGQFLCQAQGVDIKGTGRTPELALEAAQAAQQTFMAQDTMGGKGFRTVTAAELGIAEP